MGEKTDLVQIGADDAREMRVLLEWMAERMDYLNGATESEAQMGRRADRMQAVLAAALADHERIRGRVPAVDVSADV